MPPPTLGAILVTFVSAFIINAPNLALSATQPLEAAPPLTTALIPSALIFLALYAISPTFIICLSFLLTPLALMEMLYVLRYERVTDEHVLAIMSETNIQEAISWLGPIGWALIASSVLIIPLGAWLNSRTINNQPSLPRRWKAILLFTGAISTGFLSAADLIEYKDKSNTSQPPKELNNSDLTNEILSTQLTGNLEPTAFNNIFPWGLPSRIKRYLDLQEGIKSAKQELANFRFGASQSATRLDDHEVFLLVIGETGRPDRWQINGYERPTNPRLSSLPGIVSFSNATTSWAWTRMSVPIIVSRKPPQARSSFFPERSIVSAFREAGFWTAWYSMHGALGFHESPVSLYANESDDTRYINPAGYRSPGAYDGALLTALDDALRRPERKKFVVLHTMGSHFNYAHRVPPEFEIFQPSLRNKSNADLHNKSQRQQLNNSYDNSIIYTDHVLAEIIQRLAATGMVASLLYVADHGENIFDGNCDKSGHGHNTEFDYRIASLWWNSPAFSNRYPEKVTNISANKNTPWTTENIFATLIDAGGITITNQKNGAQSLLDPAFKSPARWIQSRGYFDSAKREGVCSFLKPV